MHQRAMAQPTLSILPSDSLFQTVKALTVSCHSLGVCLIGVGRPIGSGCKAQPGPGVKAE